MPANEAPPTPIPASYWVVPGLLCAGEYPGAAETTEARAKLRRFLDTGFTFYLDLTEDRDLAPYAALLHEEAATRGLAVEHRRMPIVDLGTPTPAQTQQILYPPDPCVTEEFLMQYVAYKAETNSVDVVRQAKHLQLSPNMAFPKIDHPKGICKDVTGPSRRGNDDVEMGMALLEKLPYVIGLVR